MSDLLEKLKLGTNNAKLISWPGTQTKVLLKVLSQAQTQEAAFAVERMFKSEKIEINLLTAEEYDNELATQKLFRALRDPQKPEEPIATSISIFRMSMTKEEKKVLIDEYLSFEKECSPSPDGLSDGEFDKLLSELKKTPQETLGSITSISVAKKLLLIMASPAKILPKVSG